MMQPQEVLNQALQQASACIARVESKDLANKTPCTEWDLRALLNHLVYEVLWVPDIVAGKTVAEVGDTYEGDVLKDAPEEAWKIAAQKAKQAANTADLSGTAHLSYGDIPVSDYIVEVASDVVIHTWDIGQSIGCTLLFDEQLLQAVYDYMEPRVQGYRDAEVMGPAIPVSQDADLETRLLAMVGRKNGGDA